MLILADFIHDQHPQSHTSEIISRSYREFVQHHRANGKHHERGERIMQERSNIGEMAWIAQREPLQSEL